MLQPEVAAAASAAVDGVGCSGFNGFPEAVLDLARLQFRIAFGAVPDDSLGIGRSSFESNILEALLKDASDPEVDVPEWLRTGCPTGVGSSRISARGIFPAATSDSAAVEQSKVFAKIAADATWCQESHSNYISFTPRRVCMLQKR